MRRDTPSGSLFLTDAGPARLPDLRMEMTDGRRMLLRQAGRPVLLARVDQDHGGVTVHRREGYRSPLPPLTAAEARRGPDWRHRFAGDLERVERGPLHAGRWLLAERRVFPPYVWRGDLVRDWPTAHLDWNDGWNGVLPLRPLSAPGDPRVKAYRRQAREGVLPPVLLWWLSPFDGWAVLDGHDRAVAALAEGRDPDTVVLVRVEDESEVARRAADLLGRHEDLRARTLPGRRRPGRLRGRRLPAVRRSPHARVADSRRTSRMGRLDA
ncbi:hypothetical protein [Streptomyces roseoviridis]|uniref:Uncharacterized protein n=1 Tax=Streptomyces roseoviridis TaxID=67361 RepID=A0ABV5QQF4_9ACTN